MYKIKAIRFVQNERVFYTAVIPAEKLIKMTAVDVWDPDNPDTGYQRAPSEDRKREIGQYAMQSTAVMPVGGLLNARAEDGKEAAYGTRLKFEAEIEDGSIAFGALTIPDKALPLFIVDMQHRLGGYEVAIAEEAGKRLANFPLVVTIADGLSKMEEVDQFDLINTTQKKVRTDLARRLKSIQAQDKDHMRALDQRGRLWEARGPMVAQILNSEKGVWFERILPPNKSKADQPRMVVRETSFVTSLKPVLQTPYVVRQSEENAAALLVRYWEAIRRLWPQAFVNPENYVIQKSPGVFSLHEVAPEVFEVVRDRGELTVDNIYSVVKALGALGGAEFWLSKSPDGAAAFGSMKGFRILASQLREHLPTLDGA